MSGSGQSGGRRKPPSDTLAALAAAAEVWAWLDDTVASQAYCPQTAFDLDVVTASERNGDSAQAYGERLRRQRPAAGAGGAWRAGARLADRPDPDPAGARRPRRRHRHAGRRHRRAAPCGSAAAWPRDRARHLAQHPAAGGGCCAAPGRGRIRAACRRRDPGRAGPGSGGRAGRRDPAIPGGAGRGAPDDLARQVLVLNIRAGGELLGGWLTEAAEAGEPFRVTLHQLTTMPIMPLAIDLRVCETPAVLRAAAGQLGADSAPLVCTEGEPSVARYPLLRAAVTAGTPS